MALKIATMQLPANDFGLATIKEHLRRASAENVDIICFPEGYLNGYTRDETQARNVAINLASQDFAEILAELEAFTTCAIIGTIEVENGKLFNTAIVIKSGKLLGKYCKTHPQEGIFEAGTEYPVFNINGHKFGVNICYDANFPEASQKLVAQGAEIVFFPLNNMLPTKTAEKWQYKHIENLVQRAREAGIWTVSSDVFAELGDSVGYGCTAIVNPGGKVTEKAQDLQQAMIMTELS